MNIDTVVRDVIDESLGMWRFRWPALAVAWVIALGGWLWALNLQDEWDATTRVYVDTDSLLDPLMRGLAVQQNPEDQVALMSRALLSRPHLQAVAMESGLDIRAPSPEALDALLNKLESDINFSKTPRDKLYSISYRDHDPIMARVVVQSLLNHFMDESFGENQSESQNAQDFILKQLGENEVRLLEAENRLAEFKKRNVNLMPGQDGDYFQQLILAKSNTTRLQAITNQVELRRAELLRQLEGEEPSVGIMSSSGGLSAGTIGDSSSANSGQIAQLESQLQNMLLNLTEKHPDVVRIREQIADLRKNDEQEITSQTEATAPLFNRNTLSGSAENELEGNPIYEHMRIELSTSEVQLVTLRAELAEEQKKVAYLSKMVDTIPEVEAELMRLNRDYGVVKSQYETLLSRLESAKLAEDIQQDTKDITFRVIDPPYVPLTPSGPNRQPMIAAMLIIALCAAAGLTFLLNQQRPVFFSARKLRTDTGLPIYGVIGITKANQKIAAHIWFTAGTCGLFALWLLLLVAERQITDAFHIITSRL